MIICRCQVENPSVKNFGNLQIPRHLREGLGTVTVKAQREKHVEERGRPTSLMENTLDQAVYAERGFKGS